MINRLFNQGIRAGIFGEPPKELVDQDLKIKYISTLAMAQKAVATQSLERTLQFAGALAQLGYQDALKKIDAAQMIDEHAKATGVTPTVIIPDEVLEEQKRQEQEMAAQQQQLIMAEQAANVGKTAAEGLVSAQELEDAG